MRLTSFAVILGLLGASMALTKKPSDYKLEWLNSGKVMKITFPDKTTDEIPLKADKDNNCFFHGYLNSDLESEVEVDGCKGNVEVVEIDSRLVRCGLVFLLLEADGKTYEIDPTEGFQLNKTDSVVPESLDPPAAMQGSRPTSVVAKVHLRYDPSILEMVGGSHLAAKRKIKAIVDLSRPWFKRTRNLAMDIEIKIMSIEAYQPRIPDSDKGALESLVGRGSSGSGHITAFFRTAQWGLWGVAYLGTICRRSTTNVHVNAIRTGNDVRLDAVNAMLFAHELGHNLGMEHDFSTTHGGPEKPGTSAPHATHYGPCDNKGIMSYTDPPPSLPRWWSDCSRSDQVKYFEERGGHQCLKPEGGGNGDGGNGGGNGCQCNGESVAWGNTQLGHCDDSIKIDCGNWCIVDPGKCPGKQFYWHAMKKYISCSPCDNTRSLPALRKAECPAEGKDTGNGSPRLIGAGIGLLAAGLLMELF